MSIRCTGRRKYIVINIVILIITILESSLPVKGTNIVYIDDPYNATFAVIETKTDKRFTIKTEGCVIPTVNPNDMSVRKYLDPVSRLPPACEHHKHPLISDNGTHLIVQKENFKFYRIDNGSRLICCYTTFYRPQTSFGIPDKKAANRVKYSDCILFRHIIKVYHEFVHIKCNYRRRNIYNQYFVFTPKKTFTSYRANPFASDRSMYNILILGMGSVSRQNFYRTMPKTWNMLKNYEAVELKGYNTVASDTFQNLIPVLLGMNTSEMRSTCWPKPQDTLDSCPYIWERFKDVGYYTALAEDTAKYGVFHMGKPGFRGNPTDYYIYPFVHESESAIEPHQSRNRWRFTRRRVVSKPIPTCMGDKYYYEVLLNYIESLTSTLSDAKLFGLFWESSISHDDFSSPQMMDDAYVRLLKSLEVSNYLDSTIIIFLSDHGMNLGDVHFTKQGQIEQRQPVFYMFTPASFRIEFKLAYQNLKLNKDRLTTPFDVHSTLVDLLDLNDITDAEIARRSKETYSNQRGISLFLPIPGNRTCKMAAINNKWCNCYNYVKLTLRKFSKIVGANQFLTKHLNEPLKPYSQCSQLNVVDIVEVYELVPGYEKNTEWRDFKIIIRTTPGGGVFEAVLRYYKKSNRWSLVNAIKRLNANSSNDCVDDAYVKLYCYCK